LSKYFQTIARAAPSGLVLVPLRGISSRVEPTSIMPPVKQVEILREARGQVGAVDATARAMLPKQLAADAATGRIPRQRAPATNYGLSVATIAQQKPSTTTSDNPTLVRPASPPRETLVHDARVELARAQKQSALAFAPETPIATVPCRSAVVRPRAEPERPQPVSLDPKPERLKEEPLRAKPERRHQVPPDPELERRHAVPPRTQSKQRRVESEASPIIQLPQAMNNVMSRELLQLIPVPVQSRAVPAAAPPGTQPSIAIGTVEVHIEPPPMPAILRRSPPAARVSLSRGFGVWGLRQS
jgi:hypothetical protein